MIPDSVTIEDSITKFCSSLRFMDNADCRHCLTTNIEMQLIDGTRPKQWKDRNPGSEGIPFKDRTVRELSRIYRDIERNHSVKQVLYLCYVCFCVLCLCMCMFICCEYGVLDMLDWQY